VRTQLSKPEISDRGNIIMFDKGIGLDLRNESRRRARSELIEAERMSAIGSMACSISHDMRHSLSAIYANAEFLDRDNLCASERADLLLEIQEAVLAMTERLDSLLQFCSNGRKNPLVHERVSRVVERAVAAVKFHPDGRNVSITAGTLPPSEADIDARNLESAIYNLLLNACQAAIRSTQVPEVKVQLTEADEWIYVTILDNGPGVPSSVRRTLFDPFVTAGKPNGTGLGLTLARRIAEEHGGSVYLEESHPEKTAFTLSLTKNRLLTLEDMAALAPNLSVEKMGGSYRGIEPGIDELDGIATSPSIGERGHRPEAVMRVEKTRMTDPTEEWVVSRAPLEIAPRQQGSPSEKTPR
jgi:signal transduction histidine kinase